MFWSTTASCISATCVSELSEETGSGEMWKVKLRLIPQRLDRNFGRAAAGVCDFTTRDGAQMWNLLRTRSRWVNYPQVCAALSCSLCIGLIVCKKSHVLLRFYATTSICPHTTSATGASGVLQGVWLSQNRGCESLKTGLSYRIDSNEDTLLQCECVIFTPRDGAQVCAWSESDSSLGVVLRSPKSSSHALLPL